MGRKKQYNYWLDGYIKSNLDIVKDEAIPNKWDAVFIIFGREGVGKTTFGSQGSHYLSNKFNINHCCFTPEQFEQAIEDANEEDSILWDEAITGANVSLFANLISISIISRLTQIRKKKLKIFLCFPYLHMLNKYFIARCMGSFYIYAKDFSDRGYGFFYNYEETQFLYGIMKEKYKHTPLKAITMCNKSFYFKFDRVLCLPEKEYDEKKEESRKLMDAKATNQIWRDRTGTILKCLREDFNISTSQIAKKTNIKKDNLYALFKQ